MAWQIVYGGRSKNELSKLSKPILERTVSAFETKLMRDPIRHSKPLSGSLREYRVFRVGDYRILFSLRVDDEIIVVHKIAHRREVYER